MRRFLKKIIQNSLHALGFDLYRLTPSTNAGLQLCKGLDKFGIDLVLDIGANIGQFAEELRSIGYEGRIVSFEPLPKEHAILSRSASRDSMWDVHDQVAIGDMDGQVDINIAGKSASSSILPMLDLHAKAAKGSGYVGKVTVPMARLDSIAQKYIAERENYFVKIDTQGYEWQVLDGAPNTLANAKGLMCELSLVPLYEGQRLWGELIERLACEGFELWAIQKGFADPNTGRTLQIDGVFFRRGLD